MRSYLFVFEPGKAERQVVIDTIDDMKRIQNWYAFMSNAICITSELAPKELSEEIRRALPGLNFIVTRLDRDGKGGWLRKSVWQFINEPKAVDPVGSIALMASDASRSSA